jgi:nitrite reductase (NADH) small subunit/3-phenylpropionate/trans-cinnamate dioxygenase ferredoxin subunit
MASFVRVGSVRDFPRGRGRKVRVDGQEVAVFRDGDAWHALQDACPHMGASLADGKLDGGCVVCHWHEWKFELSDGSTVEREWARARVYDVKIEKGQVLLRARPPLPEPKANAEEGDDDAWMRADPESFFKKRD